MLPQIESLYALHLTSGHIPQYPQWFNGDKTLKIEMINQKLAPKLSEFDELVVEATGQINAMPGLSDFSDNFLNPQYRR